MSYEDDNELWDEGQNILKHSKQVARHTKKKQAQSEGRAMKDEPQPEVSFQYCRCCPWCRTGGASATPKDLGIKIMWGISNMVVNDNVSGEKRYIKPPQGLSSFFWESQAAEQCWWAKKQDNTSKFHLFYISMLLRAFVCFFFLWWRERFYYNSSSFPFQVCTVLAQAHSEGIVRGRVLKLHLRWGTVND